MFTGALIALRITINSNVSSYLLTDQLTLDTRLNLLACREANVVQIGIPPLNFAGWRALANMDIKFNTNCTRAVIVVVSKYVNIWQAKSNQLPFWLK